MTHKTRSLRFPPAGAVAVSLSYSSSTFVGIMLRIGRVLLFPPHSAHISAYFGGSFYLLARSIVFSSVFSQFHRAQVNFTGLVKFHAGRAVNLVAFHTQDLSCWQFLPFYTFVRHSITCNNVLHDLLTKQLNALFVVKNTLGRLKQAN